MKNITTIQKNLVFPSLGGARGGCRGMVCHIFFILSFLHSFILSAQTIGGNVYGGGNKGNVDGKTTVTVKGGDIQNVFGGARMANVGGRAFVHIDGANATGDIFITNVFAGNDIAGIIGRSEDLPSVLTDVLTGSETQETYPEKNAITNLWNAFIRVTRNAVAGHDNLAVIIGSMYGGGNGDYYYDQTTSGGKTTHMVYAKDNHDVPIATVTTDEGKDGFLRPDLSRTYLEIKGGHIAHIYGGGNNATITENTTISLSDESDDFGTMLNRYATIQTEKYPSLDKATVIAETVEYLKNRVQLSSFQADFSNLTFTSARVFGGNNKAPMAIRPTWNLQKGMVRDLYSGGNEGDMTSPEGLLLEIKPTLANNDKLIINNVYGGCRRANVRPVDSYGTEVQVGNLPGYNFPVGLSARTLVRGGIITNVYGGNDISGNVYGGNAVGIYTSILGNVYGGGNGGYFYTDKEDLSNDLDYRDFYYSPAGYTTNVDALNDFRPHAEQVSIHLWGSDENKPTIIGGSVFCGGNCATLETNKLNPRVELKIGNHVIADRVFLGNNGEKMVDPTILGYYANPDLSSIQLTDASVFARYMDGVTMTLKPNVVFDADYEDNKSMVGSFFCGGNVGSMGIPGKTTVDFDRKLIIFNKLVGGCNSADVAARDGLNAAYSGGLLGAEDERGTLPNKFFTEDGTEGGQIRDRLEINLSNITITPKRWRIERDAYGTYQTDPKTGEYIRYKDPVTGLPQLEWNTVRWNDDSDEFTMASTSGSTVDNELRLTDGNVYGGCYNSGHVNGNVVININQNLINKTDVFGGGKSNVDYESQREDLINLAMSVFGGGYGKDTEIWGSTRINLNNNAYAFQIFGGGEKGVVGKKNNEGEYVYDERYSTTVNLLGTEAGTESGLTAESENLYGGGDEGLICGNTYVNLGNGRIYDAFGGSTNADILGHAEVIIGKDNGFPWVRDNIYGGNDFGGTIKGSKDFSSVTDRTVSDPTLLTAATYVNYIQGHIDNNIFGGNYGNYDYTLPMFNEFTWTTAETLPDGKELGDPKEGFHFAHLDKNSFVHFHPADNTNNAIGNAVFGGSEGAAGLTYLNNAMQGEAYVLVDDNLSSQEFYSNMDIFGGGAFAGVGSELAVGAGRTLVDLFAGSFNNVYGGSNQEALIGYTRVNVPAESTVKVNALYGGSKGYEPAEITSNPILFGRFCDTYITCIDYKSPNARVENGIYGGNRNSRLAFDTYINIDAPVYQSNGYLGEIYGGGYGIETVSGRTNIYMNNGSNAYKVFGGGRDGNVFNFTSVTYWLWDQFKHEYAGDPDIDAKVQEEVMQYADFLAKFRTYVSDPGRIILPTSIPAYQDNIWKWGVTAAGIPALVDTKEYHNTNVHLLEGSNVSGYAYGGGFGSDAVVAGTTYLELKGGNVEKDIYGGGQGGPVMDEFNLINEPEDYKHFTASTHVYIEGGMARNVYGGGYEGDVGKHTGDLSAAYSGDIPGETNVIVGKSDGTDFVNGIPAIMRNLYGGGEGGSVYGTTNVTLNNGYIGYRYKNTGTNENPVYEYKEELDDKTPNAIEMAGNVFGGGYVVNSYVDNTNVNMYGGLVRGSLYGGGEVGPIGRGTVNPGATGGIRNQDATIYKAGKTHVMMFDGHVKRNVFGGGRGKDSWGGDGTMYMDPKVVESLYNNGLMCKGYIFGQTEVYVHGGEIGTVSGLADGDGNVFGGSDEGLVYSAYEKANGTLAIGKKDGVRYDPMYQGYYYKYENGEFVTEKVESGTYTAAEATAYNTEHASDPGFVTVSEGDKKYDYERNFTEDCKVVVEPHLKATAPVNIDGHDYNVGEYVPTSALNTLQNKNSDAKWASLDDAGIIIHNAVFAGGNTPAGSLTTSANTSTVFGNATASINDIFHRDMITLGTRHTGGLYGDGNLTLVDGYRELNITNYGTDYYSIAKEIGIDAYHALPKREADYYELKYTCLKTCMDKEETRYKPAEKDAGGNIISKASTITADEMQNLFVTTDGSGNKVSCKYDGLDVLKYDETKGEWVPNEAAGFWEESGVLPVYAGRLMNSIQRADFCGVFGSRMVMQGAQDRVPEEADYTNYTINRVREVSLNKNTKGGVDHGNYFGIYNIVNYLGALTSDVDFGDETSREYKRTTDNTDTEKYKCAANGINYGDASFYDWKKAFTNDRKRNNGNSHNKVALASGVYLEITTEESTGPGLFEKVWGPITGVVELDLINVAPGIGGGFVYAKNEHGVRSLTGHKNTTLTTLNEHAVTQWDYQYSEIENTNNQKKWETSGNFVHSTQTIIDDCYNISNRYMGDGKMPAHYWYIKGSVYVYDQYISAYTGTPNAYSETVDIPLTIAAASHGKMKLLNVMPNRYAYYATPGVQIGQGKRIIINDKSYYKNDPISYWDWYLLTPAEKELFIDKTYVNCITCKIDGVEYAAGTYIMSETDFTNYKNAGAHTYTDADGMEIKDANDNTVGDDYIFRSSNNISHDQGYILTYEVNNPGIWDNWYTPKADEYRKKKTLDEYEDLGPAERAGYEDGPTYRLNPTAVPTEGVVLGQRQYKQGDIITEAVENTYQAITNKPTTPVQAEFEKAYIVTSKITVTSGDKDEHYYPGAAVSKTFADDHSGSVDEAYICTSSISLSKSDIIYKDTKMTKTQAENYVKGVKDDMDEIKSGASTMTMEQIKALPTTGGGAVTAEEKKSLIQLANLKDEMKAKLVPAYYCTKDGMYGGAYYEKGKNYRGLEAWSSLSASDRAKFIFNYDALDLLIDPEFRNPKTGARSEGNKFQYDGPDYTTEDEIKDPSTGNKAGYSITQSVDYSATYNGGKNDQTETEGDRTGEKYMTTTAPGIPGGKVYIGQELNREQFESLPNQQRHFAPIAAATAGTYYVVNTPFQVGATPYAVGETISGETYEGLPTTEKGYVTQLVIDDSHKDKTYYYCRESYSGTVTPISSSEITGAGGGVSEGKVQIGTLITSGQYSVLPNQQKNFTIHGVSPTETSTLYMSSESNIYDLSQEKIITVIYQYDYDETDNSDNITPVSERHVLNIHLTFKSGVPTVEKITQPDIILPGDLVSLREPNVTPGAYEVTGGGWELFETKRDAESHTNGVEYTPSLNPLYWYQDDWYVAYYAKSYIGRTYSNAVPVSVANYHDLAEVMSEDNKEHHMYIDNANVKRNSKIYINDYSSIGKNGLDLFRDLYDLSLRTTVAESGNLEGHALLNEHVKAGENLEFFLRSDISHTGEWESIGTDEQCFEGNLHGDGHTISGLNKSLFYNLCGNVYNLGVTGTFNSAGVVDKGTGYVESAWIKTSGEPTGSVRAVFGTPNATPEFKQLVNSYYQTGKDYSTDDADGKHGLATAMPEKAFYNGTLAYDLNNFYLYKRYANSNGEVDEKIKRARYFTIGEDNKLTLQPYRKYENNAALCSSGYIYTPTGGSKPDTLRYVEERFADGDFRYAAGEIPTEDDERMFTDVKKDENGEIISETTGFYPIWPDDYIFFGQKLTYGYSPTQAHQDVPTAVRRDGGRIDMTERTNRVYRAPAYYGSKAMDVAHFNPHVNLAATSVDGTKEAYPGMTAIDFAGHNDPAYALGTATAPWFYPPLLDDDGLLSISNRNETKNLLAYAPAETAETGYVNKKTYGVLTGYFTEPVYDNYYDNSDGYRLVEKNTTSVNGHLVKNDLISTNDHLLIDKQDFNCPIAYTFGNDYRMWYQRTPDDGEYVDRTKGWQGISIPFTAELVTTNVKGEITHFYDGSEVSQNGTGTKIGHEYWLRELEDITASGDPEVKVANMLYPALPGDGSVFTNKTVTNTFLWNYYYQVTGVHNQKDKNQDIYQTYYRNSRTYNNYPLLTASKPYILGLPGQTYFEFDLSGSFIAQNAFAPIDRLNKQTITFASETGIGISVSDDEILSAKTLATKNGYTFVPSYSKQTIAAGQNAYTLSAAGDSYDKVPATGAATTVDAFRPYFAAVSAAPAKEFKGVRSIRFSNNDSGKLNPDEELGGKDRGGLEIYAKERKIYAVSYLDKSVSIRIVNASGATLTTFTLEPGKTVITPITNPGTYIVNKKKVFVK